MGSLGNIIDKAVDAATGKSSGTTLQDFLNNFSSSEGIWIKQIDPLATFDVSMTFKPGTAGTDKSNDDWYKKLGDSLKSAGMKAVKNAANNITGGLLGAAMNSKVSVTDKHNEVANPRKQTFLEYLAPASLLVGKDDWVGEDAGKTEMPLELQFGPYCQELTLPSIEMKNVQTANTVIGDFPINGTFVQTDNNYIQMKILNTKVSLVERIFYPWMKECTLPFWSYDTQPYTTATIKVDYTKHNDVTYIFCGCKPQKIETQQANQQASGGNLLRNVTFMFDYMFISSSLKNCEDLGDKLLSTGKTLFNSAAKMMNI